MKNIPNAQAVRAYIIHRIPTLSTKYKLIHIILPEYRGSHMDKTQKFLRQHHYNYLMAWDKTTKLITNHNTEYLKPTLFKDPFLNKKQNLYAYVYRVSNMYIKYILNIDSNDLSFRSWHYTSSKDKRFKRIKGGH